MLVSITWSAVWTSAPHSQIDEGVIPHLHMDERKHPTPVKWWFSFVHADLGKDNPSGPSLEFRIKERCLEAPLHYSALLVWSTYHATLMFCHSMVRRNCFSAGTDRFCDLSHRGCLAESGSLWYSSWPGRSTQQLKGSLSCLRRSSVGSMPARMGRLSNSVWCRYPVTTQSVPLFAVMMMMCVCVYTGTHTGS